jgi:FkbH-like protein
MNQHDLLIQIEKRIQKILNVVQEAPTYLNYWNAFKRIQKLKIDLTLIPNEKKVRIAFLSSFTIDQLAVYLDINSRNVGLFPETYMGIINQYRQEILNDDSVLYSFSPDIIILAIQAESLSNLNAPVPFENKKKLIQDILNQIQRLIFHLTSKTRALVLVNNFIVPSFTPFGILDNKIPGGIKSFYYSLNEQLAGLFRDNNQVFVVDLESVASRHGKSRYIDSKMYYRGSVLFSKSFLPAITDEYMGYVKAFKNLTRKCIVLDLDNVLWGGIIGEDGFNGIELGKDPPGNAYMDFQRFLLNYNNRGIILAINSKNNFEDAFRVIREHPYMILREKHFAALRINWENKVQNMRELAEEINIGLDSMVFLDDDPREREQIKQAYPQILVVDLPHSPFLYRQAVEALNDFNTLTFTIEDGRRGKLYHARSKRQQLKKSADSLDAFLKSLEMKIIINTVTDFSVPRIARLVNKTNQFNLTTRRYTETVIREMSEQKKVFEIYSLQVIDKFGDEGIVGVAILRKKAQQWIIDSFLMSCRVIGRRIETALLANIVEKAKQHGVATIIGEYIPTSKNSLVQKFYPKHGFKPLHQEGALTQWLLEISQTTIKVSEWLEIIDE